MKKLAFFRNRNRTAAMVLALAVFLTAAGCAQQQKAPESSAAQESAAETAAPAAETEAASKTETAEAAADTAKETETAGAAGSETGTETEAGETETAAGKEAAADSADLENNGGYFVRRGDSIYFRIYGPDALPSTALWAEFMQPVTGGISAIWKLDLKTNQYEKLFDDSGWGGLWFFKEKLWLNRSTDFGDIVYCVDLDTFEKQDLAWGQIRGISTDGSHLVYEGHTDDAAQALFVTGDEKMDQVVSATDQEYLTYCGAVGRDLFFLARTYEDDKGSDELWELKAPEGKAEGDPDLIRLGTFPDSEYGSVAEFVQFLSDGDRIYVSVEYREGTGHFYAGSHYVSAIPGKEDSMELMDEEAAKIDAHIQKVREEADYEKDFVQDPETLKMYIGSDGKPAFAYHLAGDLELSYREDVRDLILYDSTEDIIASDGITIFEGWLPVFDYAEEGGISCNEQVMEYVDGKVFTVYTESVRDPEEDIGWRYAYRLGRTIYEYFDPEDTDADTGALRHIDSVDAARRLDSEEITELNRKLDPDYCGFFLSDYHDPTEISWAEVLYNGAGMDTGITDEQIRELLDVTGEEELFTDVTAISGKDLRDFVKRTTGTAYDDAKYPLEGLWTYLPKYDLYTFQHGDTNAREIEFDGGWDLVNHVYRLHYTGQSPDHDFDSWPYMATVRIENGSWTFLSNLPE
jgi:hypothetical protein